MKKNSYPKIKLQKSIKNDIYNAVDFVTHDENIEYKNWFLPEDLRFILDGKFSKKEIKKILKEYTGVYYYIHQKEINTGFRDGIKRWKKIENQYFSLVSRIFKNHPWPKGIYTGFVTIFKMFPRWIKPKVFYFPYKDTLGATAPRVIAHEAMHFMFFSYIKAKYHLTELSEIKGKGERYVWKVSEVFNTVIENWKPYNRLIKQDMIEPYPGLEKIYAKMRKQWEKKQDVDWILDQWFK